MAVLRWLNGRWTTGMASVMDGITWTGPRGNLIAEGYDINDMVHVWDRLQNLQH